LKNSVAVVVLSSDLSQQNQLQRNDLRLMAKSLASSQIIVPQGPNDFYSRPAASANPRDH
jgi:hypothetical protein